jgi:hypothetical protein
VAAAVVGLAGLAVASLQPAPSIAPLDAGSTLAPDQRTRLSLEALAYLGYQPINDRPDLQVVRAGVIFGEAGPDGFTYHLGTEDEPFPPGDYLLEGVCRGQGTVTVRWEAGGATGSSTLICDGDIATASVTVAVAGSIELVATADDEARWRAGFAVVVTDPRIVAARNAIAGESGTFVSGGEALLTSPLADVDESGADLATYRLSAGCAGTGSITVTLQVGAVSDTRTVTCRPDAATTTVSVDATNRGDTITVTVEPDPAATGHAAVAYRVQKL